MKQSRIEYEKRVVEQMITLYCRRHDGNKTLCDDCRDLIAYAHRRLDHCRFGEAKSACKDCPIHCYSPAMRERVREVMRWAGPRMMLYHPVAALRHLLNR